MLVCMEVLLLALGGLLLLVGGGMVEGTAIKVDVGNMSKLDDAAYFHLYYGNTFKVIKNDLDGKSYLLIQNNSRMAPRTKYCTPRIKSFVVPISNFSMDARYFPGLFFILRGEIMRLFLLGLMPTMKGITSEKVASPCLLKLYNEGELQMLNNSEPQHFSQYAAHFIGHDDDQETQSCNYVTFFPRDEQAPLQVLPYFNSISHGACLRAEWIKYLGIFANDEVRANEIYDAVKSNYMCLVHSAASKILKPTVAWMEFNDVSIHRERQKISSLDWQQMWLPYASRHMCVIYVLTCGAWSFTDEAYKLKYIEDAGGENLDDSINKITYNTSSIEDLELLHAILCTVDVVIDGTLTTDPFGYNATLFLQNLNIDDKSCFGFLSSQSVWRHDKRLSTDLAHGMFY
ncbi:hypothetical protein Hanom_Chr07g00640751 [Helianthus anomalus]